jgi:membrane protease YdiL (CAAX protease family)
MASAWSRYVIALAGPFLIAAVTAAMAIAFGVADLSSLTGGYDWSVWSSVPLLLITTALLGGPLFEEVGWRGFLLPEEQRRHTPLAATVLVAIVWATWHLPLLITEPTGQRPPLPFVLWLMAQAVALTWIYNISASSVLLPILFHAAVNVSARLLLEPLVGQDGFLTVWWLMTTAYLLVAAGLIAWTHGRLGRNTHPADHESSTP